MTVFLELLYLINVLVALVVVVFQNGNGAIAVKVYHLESEYYQ